MSNQKPTETLANLGYRLIVSACICISLRLLIDDNVKYVLACFGASLVAAVISAVIQIRQEKK